MSRKVVISSLTGKPMAWDEDEQDDEEQDEDRAERRRSAAHDAQILREIPPHWGTGR
jgi:hypothetical protein